MNNHFVFVNDIVEENGKTVGENNSAKQHTIAVGTLVEILPDSYEEDTAGLRLFVVNHSRDCDGTPLYDLSTDKNAYVEFLEHEQAFKNGEYAKDKEYGHSFYLVDKGRFQGLISRHYSVDSLKVV